MPLIAADKANLSGDWKMNPEKSDWGKLPKPAGFVRKIVHNDPNLTVNTIFTTEKGRITTEFKYTTDGKESVNTVRGVEVRSIAKWDEDALTIESHRPIQGGDYVTKERWVLVQGGKAMVVMSKSTSPQTDFTVTMLLEKQ
ncbi:MAG TPA: hypothetical protein VMZ52_10605 [Bryobacteraceae bacterium]|nr:hypothetical protein [Bryobacteraceae bacterium]